MCFFQLVGDRNGGLGQDDGGNVVSRVSPLCTESEQDRKCSVEWEEKKKADIYASGGSFFRHTDFPSDPSLPFLFPQLPLNV